MTSADAIARALAAGPLPGAEAQLNLAHPARRFEPAPGVEPREAGVLLLLYPGADGELHFPLIERAGHNPRDRHRGQIGLPGGKREPADVDLAATALREAEEEVGVSRGAVRILGTLSTLYIPVSNFRVRPTVGFAARAPRWVRQASEVARVIEAPVSDLLHAEAVKYTDRPLGSLVELRRVPYFDLAGEIVWGATAMMLSEFRRVLTTI